MANFLSQILIIIGLIIYVFFKILYGQAKASLSCRHSIFTSLPYWDSVLLNVYHILYSLY